MNGRSYYGSTMAEAQTKALEDRRAVSSLSARRASPTLRDWLAEWLERKRYEVRPGTWVKYEQRCRIHIVPLLGDKKLLALTPNDVDSLRDTVLAREGVGPTTAHHVHMTLSAALHDALRRGLVHSVVTTATRAVRRDNPEMITLSDEEVDRLLAAATGDRMASLYVVAAKLGLRQGELLGLRWKDVNLDGDGSIRVVGTARRDIDGVVSIGDPKTQNGNRLLTPLPESVREALKATPRVDELVWPGPNGGIWDARNFWVHWKEVRKKAKLERPATRKGDKPIKPRFHDLRHTVATRMLDKGVSPPTVALLLGDTVQTVMSTYAHATARGLETAMATVDS